MQWLLLVAVASIFRIAAASPLPNPDPNPNPSPLPSPNPNPAPFLPPFNFLTQLLGFGKSSGTLDGSLDSPHKPKKCKCRRSATVGFFEDDEDEEVEVDEASSRTFGHHKKPKKKKKKPCSCYGAPHSSYGAPHSSYGAPVSSRSQSNLARIRIFSPFSLNKYLQFHQIFSELQEAKEAQEEEEV